jgi:hypothetical protein
LFYSSANNPRIGWVIVPISKMPAGQMPHRDVPLTIKTESIYRYLRPLMQILFSGDGLFLEKQICRPKILRILGKN